MKRAGDCSGMTLEELNELLELLAFLEFAESESERREILDELQEKFGGECHGICA